MSGNDELKVRVSADTARLRPQLQQGAADVSDFASKTKTALSDSFLSINTLIRGAMALLAGSVALVVKSTINLQDEMSKAAQKAGVTTEKFTGMAYAAKLADVGTEELTKAYAKLNGTLVDAQQGQKDAVELFRRLKLDPKQIEDADALLLALAERFESMDDGARKTALAIDIFGERIGPQLVPFLNQGRAGIEGLRDEAKRLGVVVSTDAGRASEEFNDTLTTLSQQLTGARMQIANALLPALQSVASALRDVDRNGTAVAALGKALKVAFQGVALLGANVAFTMKELGRELGTLAALAAAAATGNWAGVKAIAEAARADGKRAREELAAFERDLLGFGGAGSRKAEDRGFTPNLDDGKKSFTPLDKKPPAVEKEKSQMPAYETGLEQLRAAAAEQDAIRGLSKEAERDYWESILKGAQLTEADRLAVSRKAAAARLQVTVAEARQQGQMVEAGIEAWRESELSKIELEAIAARQRTELGLQTQADLLQQEQAFEDQRTDIQRQALNQRLQLVDPERDPVQVVQLNAQLAALEQQHQQRLADIRRQVAVQSAAQMGAIWDDLGSRMSNLWDSGIQAMLNGTLTWRNSMRAIGAELVGWFAKAVVGDMVKQWLLGQAKKLQATIAGWAAEKVAAMTGTATTMAAKTTEAGVVISANAAEAASGAAASQAPIPIVGPGLAAAAFAAIFAMVLGAKSSLKSAANGYDIPAGINPMTQLHEKEMVLPAKHADVIRGLADGGGASGGGPLHLTINAVDAQGVKRLLLNNTDALASAMRKAKRSSELNRGDLR